MTKNEMIVFIKNALKAGVSGKQIEPSRKGSTLSALKRDRHALRKCSEGKLQRMHENAVSALKSASTDVETLPQVQAESVTPKTTKIAPNVTPSVPPNIPQTVDIAERLYRLESRVLALARQIETLSASKIVTPKVTPNEATNDGWRLRLLPKVTGQYAYKKWYAMKRLCGKTRKVYLGESCDNAEAKIHAWLENHHAELKGE